MTTQLRSVEGPISESCDEDREEPVRDGPEGSAVVVAARTARLVERRGTVVVLDGDAGPVADRVRDSGVAGPSHAHLGSFAAAA